MAQGQLPLCFLCFDIELALRARSTQILFFPVQVPGVSESVKVWVGKCIHLVLWTLKMSFMKYTNSCLENAHGIKKNSVTINATIFILNIKKNLIHYVMLCPDFFSCFFGDRTLCIPHWP